MKTIKKLLLLMSLCIVSVAYFNNFAKFINPKNTPVRTQAKQTMVDADMVVTAERKKIEESMIEAEKIKTAATLIINTTDAKLAKNEISALEAAKIIGEQNYKIEQAEKKLAQIVSQSVDKVEEIDAQESYMNQLVTGIQDFGARILAPFKSGYGYSEQEKDIARAIIAELTKQLNELEREYAAKIATANNQDKIRLGNEFNIIKQEFNNEIYQQQLITGDAMNTNRKLFWTAVGLAGTVAGGALAKKYFEEEAPELESSEEQNVAAPASSEGPISAMKIPSTPHSGIEVGKDEKTPSIFDSTSLGEVDISVIEPNAIDYLNLPEFNREGEVKGMIGSIQPTEEMNEFTDKNITYIEPIESDFENEYRSEEGLREAIQAKAAQVKETINTDYQKMKKGIGSDIERFKEDVIREYPSLTTTVPQAIEKGAMLGEQGLERLKAEEEPGRSQRYESISEPGESYWEKLQKALSEGATVPINPESGI